MIKRLLWLATGFGLGVAASVRARRRVRRVAPGTLLHRARRELGAAVDEGRREMQRREATLRAVLAAPGTRDDGR